MNQLLLVLITALVTGILSVSGIWVGSRLTRDNEDRKWRRDHALEAYSQFVEAVDEVRFESDRIYISTEYECGTEEHKKQAEVVLDKMVKSDRLAQRLFLLAPEIVNARAMQLTAHMGTEIVTKSIVCPKIGKNERDAAMKHAAQLLVYFRSAARNDLDIHLPLHTREEWDQIRLTEKRWWRLWR